MERNEISSLLEQLYRHRKMCEMIWLKADEVDSPEAEVAREHLNGVEECVQIVRAWADDALSAQADCDTISGRPHDMPKSADCISRSAAIDAVLNICNTPCNEYFAKAISALPSSDAVQGEWLRKYDEEINCYWYECNQCGSRPPLDQWRHEWHSEYCPNCGAKMTKGGEDDEA